MNFYYGDEEKTSCTSNSNVVNTSFYDGFAEPFPTTGHSGHINGSVAPPCPATGYIIVHQNSTGIARCDNVRCNNNMVQQAHASK